MKVVGHFVSVNVAGALAVLLVAGSHLRLSGDGATLGAASGPATTGEFSESPRLPAVAGLFYPKDSKTLAASIDHLLETAKPPGLSRVRALICPHAGYEYSGPTAAYGYKLIAGGNYRTVVILGPSHYADFRGASVPSVTAYQTPLGQVPVSRKVRELTNSPGFVVEQPCQVERPQWTRISSKPEGPPGTDSPDTWEHSVEVQVPFLQRTLTNFEIIPVVFGDVDPEQVARGLARIVDDQTLVVASSDLSHYHPYDEARKLDQRTVAWIKEMDIKTLESSRASQCACGRVPVLALLYLAKLKGWQPQLLDYRNSGDTAGDKSRVVGYSAIALIDAPAQAAATKEPASPPQDYSEADRKFLLELARKTLERCTAGGGLPEVADGSVPAACRADRGCFVTLTKDGELRGCIGNILPAGPLFKSVSNNARSAALRDFRFRPVTAPEASGLRIEISVLSALEPLRFDSPEDLLAKLRPNRDGVVLRIGGAGATFLPQVWEQLPDKAEFLSHLSEKAGCAPSAWRGKDVTVSIYHVEAFHEAK